MKMNKVYVNCMSHFLPNEVVSNSEIEDFLGSVGEKTSKVKKIVLRRNGIKKRYYVLKKSGEVAYNNAEITAMAVNELFTNGVNRNNVEMLCCATASPDQLIPSHASMVHGRLKITPLEIASFSGACLTSLQALKNIFYAIQLGEKNNGICTASEVISPSFKAENYKISNEYYKELGENPYMEFEKEFLRYMLSDGAAALYVENKPNKMGPSLAIEWIETKSYANTTPACMYMGGVIQEDGELKGWKEFDGKDLIGKSVLSLCQNFKILLSGMKYWVDFIEEIILKHDIDTQEIDFIVPHVSSMFIGEELKKELIKRDIQLYDNWFLNLSEVGNIGSASIFIALEELLKTKNLKKGSKILLLVPESARFSYGASLLTVS